MTHLLAIRFITSGYIDAAERLGWGFLKNDAGERDVLLGARFGDEVIAAAVLRLEPNPHASGKRRKGGAGLKGGKGVVRAWTTALRYRGRGVGSDVLFEAVRVTKEKCGRDAAVGFAKEHANSIMVMPRCSTVCFGRGSGGRRGFWAGLFRGGRRVGKRGDFSFVFVRFRIWGSALCFAIYPTTSFVLVISRAVPALSTYTPGPNTNSNAVPHTRPLCQTNPWSIASSLLTCTISTHLIHSSEPRQSSSESLQIYTQETSGLNSSWTRVALTTPPRSWSSCRLSRRHRGRPAAVSGRRRASLPLAQCTAPGRSRRLACPVS